MLTKYQSKENLPFLDYDFGPGSEELVAIDRANIHVVAKGLSKQDYFAHELRTPKIIRALLFEMELERCLASDDDPENLQDYYVIVFNLKYKIKLGRIKHVHLPVMSILSLKNTQGFITATNQTVYFWRMDVPKLVKEPVDVADASLEIDMKDCFYKSATEAYITTDGLELDIGLTRLTGVSGKQCTYSTFFFALNNADEGYCHKINYKTESLIEKVIASNDGSFLLVMTLKKVLYMVNTDNGEPVYDINPPWSQVKMGIELAVPNQSSRYLAVIDIKPEIHIIELKTDLIKKRIPLTEGLFKRVGPNPKLVWAEETVLCISCDSHLVFYII